MEKPLWEPSGNNEGRLQTSSRLCFPGLGLQTGTTRTSHLLEMIERVKVRASRTLLLVTHGVGRSHICTLADTDQIERGVEILLWEAAN